MSNLTVLIFVKHFSPGYKYGGISVSVLNGINLLKDKFNFSVVTLDRDLGDVEPYSSVIFNSWIILKNINIYYMTSKFFILNYFRIYNIIKFTKYDCIHLNSFFDIYFTLPVLLFNFLGFYKEKKILLSPRGELIAGCFKIKPYRKLIYSLFMRLLLIKENVYIHVSTEIEKYDMLKLVNIKDIRVIEAIDPPKKIDYDIVDCCSSFDISSPLRCVFISRITPEKNLHFLQNVLPKLNINIVFDIYGPYEDINYFNYLKAIFADMPSNVKINFCGSVSPESVPNVISKYEIFLFPSCGENYAHVIAEALLCGVFAILSNKTRWNVIKQLGIGDICDLDNPSDFIDALNGLDFVSRKNLIKNREYRIDKAIKLIFDDKVLNSNESLYLF